MQTLAKVSKALLVATITLALAACTAKPPAAPITENPGPVTENPTDTTTSKLVWSDDFSGSSLDAAKWGYQTGNGFGSGSGYVSGWGNNELEYYTDRPENVTVQDGNLVINALKGSYTGDANGTSQSFDWTSGRIRTAGKFSRKYGKFEIRAKLPAGQGLWPAIWMLPEEPSPYGTWAASGEIDITEVKGALPSKVFQTLHYGGKWPNNSSSGQEFSFPNAGSTTDWHTYALEWRPGEIKWLVDGEVTSTKTQWWSASTDAPSQDADLNAWPAPFDQPFYLLLNLAVGGNFGGNPDATTPDAGQMLVDYVRVYSLDGEGAAPGPRPAMTYPWTPKPARPALDDGNLIYNPSFDWTASNPLVTDAASTITGADDSYFWTFYKDGGGDATLSNEGGTLKVDISNPGSAVYHTQVRQDGINIVNLKRYEVKFDAWASTSRNITLKVGGGPDRGWAAYSGERSIALTTTPNEAHTVTFDMLATTDPVARLEFSLGNAGANTVWIDNVSVKAIGDVPVRQPLEDGNLIYNGSFSDEDPSIEGIAGVDGSDYWSFWKQDWMNVTPSITGGELKLAVVDVDVSNNWNIQLMQKKISLFKGENYTLTFKGHASDDRTVAVVVGEDGGSYARYLNDTAALTSTGQTFSYTFTAPVTNYAAQLQILGAVGTAGDDYDLYFDDFKLVKN